MRHFLLSNFTFCRDGNFQMGPPRQSTLMADKSRFLPPEGSESKTRRAMFCLTRLYQRGNLSMKCLSCQSFSWDDHLPFKLYMHVFVVNFCTDFTNEIIYLIIHILSFVYYLQMEDEVCITDVMWRMHV